MFGFFKKKQPVKKVAVKTKPAQVKVKNKVEEMAPNDVLRVLNSMQKELDKLKLAVTGGGVKIDMSEESSLVDEKVKELSPAQKSEMEKVIEGVFDGQNMIGADGDQYDVPANYASKSKLVEGDMLKLTINNLGAFVYKQTKPIDRIRKVGELDQDDQSLQFYALADKKKWKLLTASVTYFKGEPGEEIVFLIPAERVSKWAAVENIVK